MNDLGFKRSPAKNVAFLQQLIHVGEFRREDAKESGLHIHGLIEWQVVAVHGYGSAGGLMKFAQTAAGIDVRVGADNGLYGELMAAQKGQDANFFIARGPPPRF